jgi:ketosteroid isomerase-like protein
LSDAAPDEFDPPTNRLRHGEVFARAQRARASARSTEHGRDGEPGAAEPGPAEPAAGAVTVPRDRATAGPDRSRAAVLRDAASVAFDLGDADTFRARFHPDCSIEFRFRYGGIVVNVDTLYENLLGFSEQGYETTRTVLDTPGDGLVLEHLVLEADGAVTERYVITETDRELITAVISFDETQLDEARAELDRRWSSGAASSGIVERTSARVAAEPSRADEPGDGVAPNRAWQAALAGTSALDREDRDAFDRLLAEDFVAEVFNPLMRSIGDDGRVDDRTTYLDVVFGRDLVGHGHRRDVVLRATRGDDLCAYSFRVTSPSGDVTERIMITELRDGLVARICHFRSDQLDEAVAEVDRRYVERLDEDGAALLPNAAWRTCEAIAEAGRRHDRQAIEQLVAPDPRLAFHGEVSVAGADREWYISTALDVRGSSLSSIPLEWRGEHLCLYRSTSTFDDATSGEYVVVVRTDDEHRLVESHRFDVDRRRDAQELLEQLGAEESGLRGLASLRRTITGAWEGDVETLESVLAAEFVRVDHRPLGMGEVSRQEFVDSMTALVAPDEVALYVPAILDALDDRLLLSSVRWEADRNVIELLVLNQYVDGRIERQESFDTSDLAGARRRFRELASELGDASSASSR